MIDGNRTEYGFGSGIATSSGDVSLNDSTVSRNNSGSGGGIFGFGFASSVSIQNWIVAGNKDNGTAPDADIFSSVEVVENSLIGDTTG